MTNVHAGEKATAREWLGLAVLILPCLVLVMDFAVLHLAVPTLTVELKPTPAQLLWIIDIYGFLLSGSLIIMGNLGDRIGRRKLLMRGGAAFGIASLAAAYATGAPMLIAARAVLGVAGATIAPSTLALISNMFRDEHERTRAISIWGASFAAGAVLGLLVGGVVLKYFTWGAVFLINVPVMALLLLAGPRLLPEYRDPRPKPLDLLSAALSLAAVLTIIYGLKRMAESGASAHALWIMAAGALIGTAFLVRQTKLEQPLVELRLLLRPLFAATLTMFLLSGVVMYAINFYLAQYLQLVRGFTPLEAGLCTAPSALAVVGSSLAAPWLTRHARPAPIMVACVLLSAAGFAMFTWVDHMGVWYLIAATTVLSLGMGPVGTLASVLIVASAPPERAGAAAALSETSAEFGGASGLALLGSLGVAIYRRALGSAALAGLPPEAAVDARKTLAGAVDAASRLPAEPAHALLALARGAFMNAFVTVAIVCGVLMLAAAAFLAWAASVSPSRS